MRGNVVLTVRPQFEATSKGTNRSMKRGEERSGGNKVSETKRVGFGWIHGDRKYRGWRCGVTPYGAAPPARNPGWKNGSKPSP